MEHSEFSLEGLKKQGKIYYFFGAFGIWIKKDVFFIQQSGEKFVLTKNHPTTGHELKQNDRVGCHPIRPLKDQIFSHFGLGVITEFPMEKAPTIILDSGTEVSGSDYYYCHPESLQKEIEVAQALGFTVQEILPP